MKKILQKLKDRFPNFHLNVFDYIVILSLVVIFATFLAVRYSKKTEWVTVKVRIQNEEWWWEGQPPDFWYVDELQPHQEAYSAFGEKIAEITNVENFDIGGTKRRVSVDMKVKATFDKKQGIYFYNFQPLQIGKPLDLTFGKNNLKGVVTYIQDNSIPYVMKKIEVKVFTVRPWVADSYQKGLQMKDSSGKALAEIEDVSSKPASSYEFYDSAGRRYVFSGSDPNFQDMTLVVNVLVYRVDGVDYFLDGAAIKLGENIWLHFPQTILRGAEISKIYD